MSIKNDHLIKLLESWEKGYLSSSAQMVMKHAKETIIEQEREIALLNSLVDDLREKVDKMNYNPWKQKNTKVKPSPKKNKEGE